MDAKDELKRTTLRLSRELYDRVEAVAEANNRSMNAEIAIRLEDSLDMDGGDIVRIRSKDLDGLDPDQANAEFRKRIMATANYLIDLVEREVELPPRDTSIENLPTDRKDSREPDSQ